MDDDVDIYGDLPSFNLNDCTKCKEKSKELTEKDAKFEEETLSWKKKLEKLEEEKKIILTNTSSLMKTARSEIDRKDKIISELRKQLDDLTFRRGGPWGKGKTNRTESGGFGKKPETKQDKEINTRKDFKESVDTDQKWHAGNYDERSSKKMSSDEYRKQASKTKNDVDKRKTTSDEDEEDAEQKYEPGKQNSTIYGERLRKKIILEQEAERMEKERAKLSAESTTPLKIKEEIKEEDSSEKLTIKSRSNAEEKKPLTRKTLGSDVLDTRDSKDDCKNREFRNPCNSDESSNPREEGRRDEDIFHRCTNFEQNSRSESLGKSQSENRSRISRERSANSDNNRGNRKYHDSERNRKIHEKGKTSNYSSRSRTPDRRHDENKKYERFRENKLNNTSDKYEKREENGVSREKNNYKDENNKNIYDLRGKLNHRNYDSDNHRNYDSDHRRRGDRRSPTKKSRSRSSQSDKRFNKRSESRERIGKAEIKEKLDNERQTDKRESKKRKISSPEIDKPNLGIVQAKSLESLKKNSDEDPGKAMVKSDEPEVSPASIEIPNNHENGEKSIDEAVMEILINLLNQVEARDKFISMLENDSTGSLSPLKKVEIQTDGSQSFREEKIENIEKFIHDYKYEDSHCNLLGNGEPVEQDDENKIANSTRSIVDALSLDIEDVVNDEKLEDEILKNSEYSISLDKEDPKVDRKLERDEKTNDEEKPFENLTNEEKILNIEIDEKMKNISAFGKSDGIVFDEKLNNSPEDDKIGNSTVDKKLEDAVVVETIPNLSINKESKNSDKMRSDEEKIYNEIDKKIEDTSTEEQLKKNEIVEKPDIKSLDDKTKNIEKKLEKDGCDENSINSSDILINEKSEDLEIEERSIIIVAAKNWEDCDDNLKTNDSIAPRKPEVLRIDDELKNCKSDIEPSKVSLNLQCEDLSPDEKLQISSMENNSKIVSNDKKLELVDIVEKPENTIVNFLPPLPPILQLSVLPPLPPSPPPEEKEPEISLSQQYQTVKPEDEKIEAQNFSKQTKKRPRIPILPIVSLYSRKRRDFILTDSVASHTIVKSGGETDALEGMKEKIQCSQNLDIEQEIILKSTTKLTTSSKQSENQLENLSNERSLEPETRNSPEQFVETKEVSKNIFPTCSSTENCVPESSKPEVKITANTRTPLEKKAKDELALVSSSNENDTDPRKKSIESENKGDSNEPEMECKKAQKMKNHDKTSTTKNSTLSMTSERGKRSALKSIVSTVPSNDAGSSNRKRPLSREKENQSKPAKQTKIMIISRRRPIQLEDSSTATTLVSSEHEKSSRHNDVNVSTKVNVPGKKNRTTE